MERSSANNQAATVGGIVLVGLGVLFLAQQAVGFDIGHYGWPIFVLLPGLAFLAAFALGPRGAAGLAVPGCVVTTIGLILAIQNTFNLWATWAYAWGLIVAAVGLGLTLQGERFGQPRVVRTGIRLFEGGLLAFVVFRVLRADPGHQPPGHRRAARHGRPGRPDPGRAVSAAASPTRPVSDA